MPIIVGTLGAEAGYSQVQGQYQQFSEMLFKKKWAGYVAQWQCAPVGLIPSTIKHTHPHTPYLPTSWVDFNCKD